MFAPLNSSVSPKTSIAYRRDGPVTAVVTRCLVACAQHSPDKKAVQGFCRESANLFDKMIARA
jgi:hypothetical protein